VLVTRSPFYRREALFPSCHFRKKGPILWESILRCLLHARYTTLHYLSYPASILLVMPRHARLDAPDTLHHVMVRGLERRAIFRDDTDREDFVARVAALAEAGAWTVYAWALLPNHAHLLIRTGSRPLPRSMRSLLTGYAGAFNRRHTGWATSSRIGTSPSWLRRSRTSWSWSAIST